MIHRRLAHPAAPRALAAAGLLLALAASADAPDEFAREILDAHNCYRAAHGVPALAQQPFGTGPVHLEPLEDSVPSRDFQSRAAGSKQRDQGRNGTR